MGGRVSRRDAMTLSLAVLLQPVSGATARSPSGSGAAKAPSAMRAPLALCIAGAMHIDAERPCRMPAGCIFQASCNAR